MDTVISLRFPAGRYHATPWDSHVNEAAVEWPPSAWRILRALVAQWHRKASPSRFPEATLETLIGRLSESDPLYRLPATVASHTRHYMPVRKGKSDKKALIFDAFARIDPTDSMVIAWPDVSLDSRERELLSALLDGMAYLGRAESWVEARLLDTWDGEFNAAPVGSAAADQTLAREPVRLIAPVAAAEYVEWRARTLGELGLECEAAHENAEAPARDAAAALHRRTSTGHRRPAQCRLEPATGSENRHVSAPAAGRSGAHAASSTHGLAASQHDRAPRPRRPTAAAYRGRRARRRAGPGRGHQRVRSYGRPDRVPPEISGHGETREMNHQHAFYLPEDADHDGRIDHVLIHAPGGLPPAAVTALAGIRRLWTRDGAEWQVVFEGAWPEAEASQSIHTSRSVTWTSVTPYLHPWHTKAGFGVPEQLRRECERRGLPPLVEIRQLSSVRLRGRDRRPVHFHRFRSRRGLNQPDRRGSLGRGYHLRRYGRRSARARLRLPLRPRHVRAGRPLTGPLRLTRLS